MKTYTHEQIKLMHFRQRTRDRYDRPATRAEIAKFHTRQRAMLKIRTVMQCAAAFFLGLTVLFRSLSDTPFMSQPADVFTGVGFAIFTGLALDGIKRLRSN